MFVFCLIHVFSNDLVIAGIFSLEFLSFSIGKLSFNAYTYPAYFSLSFVIVSEVLAVIYLDNVKESPSTKQAKSGKQFYLSKGILLGFLILIVLGVITSTVGYAMPIVLLDEHGW
jgi:hypothetical protein